ncbi:hypothetical protein HYS47_03210 [Candidatus Woesearchaeota archaeon]|nr:hypothetical protein [Candidatus Woesearchaeota archaeon]
MAMPDAKKGVIILSVLIIVLLFSACTTVPKNVLKDRIASLSDAELEEAMVSLSVDEPSGIVGFATKKSSTATKLGVVTSTDREQAQQLIQQEQARRASASQSASRDQTSAGRRGSQSSTITSGSSSASSRGITGPSGGSLTRGAVTPPTLPRGTLIQDLTRSRALKDDMMKVLADAGLSITSKTDQVMSGDLVSLPGSHMDSVFSQVGSLMGAIGSKADLLVFGDIGATLNGNTIPDMSFDFGMTRGSRNLGFYMDGGSNLDPLGAKGGLPGDIKSVTRAKTGDSFVTTVSNGANTFNVKTENGKSTVAVPSGNNVQDRNGDYYICTNGAGCKAGVNNGQINTQGSGLCKAGEHVNCDTCNGVKCDSGQHCDAGSCVGGSSTGSQGSSGQCDPACGSGKKCEGGQCVDDNSGGSSGSQCDPLVMNCGGGMQGPLDPNDPLVKLLKACQNPGQVVVMMPNPNGGTTIVSCAGANIDTSSLVTKFGQQSQCGAGQVCDKDKVTSGANPTRPWGRGDIDPEEP